MTDPSPLLPQVNAPSKPEPSTPSCTRFVKVVIYYLLGPAASIFLYFQGRGCSDLPNYLIIFSIEIALSVIDSLLTMVHNCKLNTFLDPSQLDGNKIRETGERYKGHKDMAVVSFINFVLMMAVGIWAFVYAIQNQDVKDVGGCSGSWFILLILGILTLVMVGSVVICSIAHAIYTKVKAGSESSSSVEEG